MRCTQALQPIPWDSTSLTTSLEFIIAIIIIIIIISN
jgi:hypothetical protein